jgi:hypothetical protein
MLWIAAGFFALGLVCGAVFRLPFFVAVLFVSAVVIVASDLARGTPTVLLDMLVGIVALQVGYGIGVGARALVYSRKRRRETRRQYRSVITCGERQ